MRRRAPSPRARGEGWDEGASPLGADLRRCLQLCRIARGAQTRGEAPSSSLLRSSTSPRTRGEVKKQSRSRARFSPEPSDQPFQFRPCRTAGAFSLLPFAACAKGSGTPTDAGLVSAPAGAARALVSCPFPICGGGFRGGTLACRRPTAALAKGTYVTQGATQAMLPGTWSERVLPAFACPSPVSTSRADRSIGRHDARAGRGRAVSSRPRPPHPLRIPEYLRERRP